MITLLCTLALFAPAFAAVDADEITSLPASTKKSPSMIPAHCI